MKKNEDDPIFGISKSYNRNILVTPEVYGNRLQYSGSILKKDRNECSTAPASTKKSRTTISPIEAPKPHTEQLLNHVFFKTSRVDQ